VSRQLVISEVFGPTVQGEGPTAGRRCGFVRLGRCNLDCAWCDTPYTWDWEGKTGTVYDPADLARLTPDEVLAQLRPMHVERVVISGGEPLLQRTALTELVELLHAEGWAVEIETNGTMPPLPVPGVAYNVSPKLKHAQVSTRDPIDLEALAALRDVGASYKFVVGEHSDLEEVAAIVEAAGIPDSAVWVMPLGTTSDNVHRTAAVLADAVVARGWNFTGRLHVTLWGDERGR